MWSKNILFKHSATKQSRRPPARSKLLCVLIFALVSVGCERQQHLVQQHLLEFGTIIQITLITEDLPRAQGLLAEIERRLQAYRDQWHAWQDSDLTRFNQALATGTATQVPPSLTHLITLSRDYHKLSEGLFNPALGKLIGAYGFHASDPNEALIAAIKRDLPSMQDLKIDGNSAISTNTHLQLDLGGIAKGYAIGLIADYLDQMKIKHYIINAGGDLRTAGNRFGQPWRIGIQNPFAPGVVASLQLEGHHSLFTSGNYQRQYLRGAQRTHHIIDPRSGESSRGVTSATVLTDDPLRADVAATTLMIADYDTHERLAMALNIDDFLVISEQREILLSSTLARKINISTSWPVTVIPGAAAFAGDSASVLAQ